MLIQVYVINTKAANPIFEKVYLANILVNFKKMFQIFYKIDLLFKYQNRKFKRFWGEGNLLLQENNKIFWLHPLLVYIIKIFRPLINQIVISRKKESYYPQKDDLFDISNYVNQLYRLISIYSKSFKHD